MFIQRKRGVMAGDESATVAPEATDLLFEAEDVAELVAEVTGEDVVVEADGDEVTFAVGEDEFTVTAEEDTEILESSRKKLRGKRPVSASTNRRPAATKPSGKVSRRVTRR